jgi:hypothetical protein
MTTLFGAVKTFGVLYMTSQLGSRVVKRFAK